MPSTERNQPIDPRLVKALSHPLRERILLHMAEHPEGASSVQLSRAWGRDIGTIAYHVKRLEALGLLRLTRRVARRGAIEHRYAFSQSALTDIPLLAELLNRTSPRRATAADLGTALRRLRERRGMKPVQLARAAGLDVEQLLAIEGRRRRSAIADAARSHGQPRCLVLRPTRLTLAEMHTTSCSSKRSSTYIRSKRA